MNRFDHSPSAPARADSEPGAPATDTLHRHLERAAELAAQNDLSAEVFTQAALNIYLSKNRALREQLQAVQLAARLAVLRAQGKVGIA